MTDGQGCVRHAHAGQRGDSRPRVVWDGVGRGEISSPTQNSAQIKIYKLLISGFFHLKFSDSH